MGGTVIRAATAADLAGVRAVADSYGLLDSWPRGARAPADEVDFLDAELAFGRLTVAVAATGEIAGFCGTQPRGALTHLGDLFVRTGEQSRGLGAALLARSLDGTGPLVTFASADPRAMALYVRAGMVPRHPLVYLEGRLREPPPARAAGTVGADLDSAVALDAAASGGARERLLRWYAGLPGVRVRTVGDSYAFARDLGDRLVIGPAGGVPATLAALATAGRRTVSLALFGPHPLLPRLLAAGLRIGDLDTFMSTDPQPFRVDRYLPSVDLG